jgi:hypothetical protein
MTNKRVAPRASDAAGVGPYAREVERLVPLSRMKGWNVTDGEVDIRSWEVRTVSGRSLGVVRELLVDPKAGEVVMIDLDLTGASSHAYVPLRIVEIDRARRIVRADSADIEPVGADRTPGVLADTGISEHGTVRYPGARSEKVVTRRPVVEETIIRRRDAEEADGRF